MTLRISKSVVSALRAGLRENPPSKRDSATVTLAMTYAQAIDDDRSPAVLAKLGPPLLAALEALYMSPRVRAAVTKGAVPDGSPAAAASPTAKLDDLARRRARKGPTADMDAGAP